MTMRKSVLFVFSLFRTAYCYALAKKQGGNYMGMRGNDYLCIGKINQPI